MSTLPPGILEALQAAPGPSTSTSSQIFTDAAHDLADDGGHNKHDLLCPRGCRSVILKRGVGQLVERSGIAIDPPDHPLDPALAALPTPPATTPWWRVPSPMAFENVGFSRPVTQDAKQIKLLVCADCEVGPLGWCEVGGGEVWLACARVRYAAPRA